MTISDFVTTGNAQIDQILHGGFPANSINIIMGQPGTGKTVFAEELVFSQAKESRRPIIYLTTLSEPVSKLLTYLQKFSFFDESTIGDTVHYRDIGSELADNGLEILHTLLSEVIHELAPKIIVIDSFRALHDLSDSVKQMRTILHKLANLLTAFETTVFLLGEYTEDDIRVYPEFAVADGIVQFMRKLESNRDERFVRVLKLRGSAYLEGYHGCKITADGLTVYPRLVSPVVPENYKLHDVRLPTGIFGFDKFIGGGLLKGSTTLLAGSSGSGKTTFGLQFALEGLSNAEGNSLVLNFQENPTQLARSINFLTGKNERPDGLDLVYISPVEMQIDSIIVNLFNRIQDGRVSRVVVDAIGDLAVAANDIERLHDYLYALTQHFTVRGVTSILTFETSGGLTDNSANSQIGRLSYMSDNIIALEVRRDEKIRREITCFKARGSDHDLASHEISIKKEGLAVI
jgi:circadian clock protein KaiC